MEDIRDFITANLSEGNARELALIFGYVPPNPIALCMAQSDHFHWFREDDFAGIAGMGQMDPWTFGVWGAFSRGVERNQMLAYEQARAALAYFDALLPEGCSYHAGIPAAFAAGRRFARHLGWKETGMRRAGTLMINLTRTPSPHPSPREREGAKSGEEYGIL